MDGRILFKEAVKKGLCKPWQKSWKDDIDSLLYMYKRGIDFCITKDYPSIEMIREMKGLTEGHDIYIDSKKTISAYKETIICTCDSDMQINVDPYAVVRIYLLHNSKATINVSEGAIVLIDGYDNSSCIVTGDVKKVKGAIGDEAVIKGCETYKSTLKDG